MAERPPRLEGKVAIVTGAGSSGEGVGNGKAAAILFAREGARMLLVDFVEARAQETSEIIKNEGGDAAVFQGDMTNVDDCERMVQAAMDQYGRVDILDNNVGISQRGTVVEVSEEDWDRVMTVNLKTMVLASKAAIPRMIESGGGSIINISSILGLTGEEKLSAYCASKGAVRLFTKAVALECGRDGSGIRVNSIHPGYIHTAMMEDTCRRDYGDIPTGLAELGKSHPIGRVGEPAEIAAGVLYLASDESKFVTGSELAIDGGYTAA